MADARVADPPRGAGPGAIEPLDASRIAAGLDPELQGEFLIAVRQETGSTNDDILRQPAGSRHGRVVLAERQAAGRGRRGRRWVSPPGNIWFSLGWRFSSPAQSLDALGLVSAVCACRALSRAGLKGHGIKWPNDIQVGGAKLAGILVETGRSGAGSEAVIGIGINVHLDEASAASIDRPSTDISSHLGLNGIDRNRVVADLIGELAGTLQRGVGHFPDLLELEWPRWDVLWNKSVEILLAGETVRGQACGITPGGALKVKVGGSGESPADLRIFHSGEVSVRHG